jgi:hypothetical protein
MTPAPVPVGSPVPPPQPTASAPNARAVSGAAEASLRRGKITSTIMEARLLPMLHYALAVKSYEMGNYNFGRSRHRSFPDPGRVRTHSRIFHQFVRS